MEHTTLFYDLNCSIAVTVLSNFSLNLRMNVLHKKMKVVSSCNVKSDCALVWPTWDDDICWQDSTSFLPVSSSQRGKRWLPSQQILNNVNLWSHLSEIYKWNIWNNSWKRLFKRLYYKCNFIFRFVILTAFFADGVIELVCLHCYMRINK